jgi:hypothetical protein
MTWNIPPVGWCVTCLVARGEKTAATALYRGTSLCLEHLREVFAPELEEAEELARRDEVTPERGSTSVCLHCMEKIVYAVHTEGEWSHWRHGDKWCHDRANFTRTPLHAATPDSVAAIVAPEREGGGS